MCSLEFKKEKKNVFSSTDGLMIYNNFVAAFKSIKKKNW